MMNADPIDCITEQGVRTRDEAFDLDVLIFATGFDAVTGAFTAIDFRGIGNQSIGAEWNEGPRTQLGLLVHNFPNMFMCMGPHQMFGNIPRYAEVNTSIWISNR